VFRRLCIDVDHDGTVIGASVEFYSDRTLDMGDLLVMEPGWVDGLDPEQACKRLLADGWIQPPLPGIAKE
jgi:hypothetical protein